MTGSLWGCLTAGAFALFLATSGASGEGEPADTTSMEDYLQMQQASEAFRATADAFIAAAAAGDTAMAAAMISPNMAARAGGAAVHQFISQQVAPFFSAWTGLGQSVTISNTTDGFGSEGFAYYMYLVPEEGDPRPFVIYVVAESDTTVVANILVDHFVEGRHQ